MRWVSASNRCVIDDMHPIIRNRIGTGNNRFMWPPLPVSAAPPVPVKSALPPTIGYFAGGPGLPILAITTGRRGCILTFGRRRAVRWQLGQQQGHDRGRQEEESRVEKGHAIIAYLREQSEEHRSEGRDDA